MKKKKFIRAGIIAAVIVGGGLGIQKYPHLSFPSAKAATFTQKMHLDKFDGTSAPNFTLTDEHGKVVSLSDFKGKVVVLQFMDPKCTDICPIVSKEIVGADKVLGNKQSNVVFVTVNVNQYHESRNDLLAFSKEYGLNNLSNWYFLTGTTDELKAVWKKYGISVVPNPTGDVEHSSLMFFIDKNGDEQYLANPGNSKASIPAWSKGIAFFAEKLMSVG